MTGEEMYRKQATTIISPDNALIGAWLIALAATMGALFIGEVMGRPPCVLCWYQRIAMFPLAVVLGIACYQSDLNVRRYALPLAIAGGSIAFWHSLLFAGFIAEAIQPCTQNGPSCSGEDQVVFGYLPLPYLSLAAFCLISLLLFLSTEKGRK